jgi:hypothetical protein
MLANYIQPIAVAAGLGHIGWHTFRHSFCSWGKSALKLNETKELARHQNIATTSDPAEQNKRKGGSHRGDRQFDSNRQHYTGDRVDPKARMGQE